MLSEKYHKMSGLEQNTTEAKKQGTPMTISKFYKAREKNAVFADNNIARVRL